MMFIGYRFLPKVNAAADIEIEQEFDVSNDNPQKQLISGLILLGVVIVMALNLKFITLEMAAVIGALVAVLTGCLTEKQAYASIDWVSIFLFAGMISVSSAMDKTGAGKLLAKFCVDLLGGTPSPLFVAALLFFSIQLFDTIYVQHSNSNITLPHRSCYCPTDRRFTSRRRHVDHHRHRLRLCHSCRYTA